MSLCFFPISSYLSFLILTPLNWMDKPAAARIATEVTPKGGLLQLMSSSVLIPASWPLIATVM